MVEAENKCQLSSASAAAAVEMRVSQVSCISTRWTTEKLDREQGLLCLLPSESGVVHLKGSRHEEREEGEEEGKGEDRAAQVRGREGVRERGERWVKKMDHNLSLSFLCFCRGCTACGRTSKR